MTRISFCILALNAQPFLEYNLRALYPFAHQIIVVEGATLPAKSLARADGHSSDGTLEMLEDFKLYSDPEKKVEIVLARDEGFTEGYWPEKDQMSQAFARRITGDWLWQVDSDEFYKDDEVLSVIRMLEGDPAITAVSFTYLEFFGGFSSVITGEWHLYEHPRFHRLFRWKQGYVYQSHRPPTVIDETGIDLRNKKWVSTPRSGNKLITLYHYSYVFPKQVEQKVGYYSNVAWTDAFQQNHVWMNEEYLQLRHPMFLGERRWPVLQWLEIFSGDHPHVISQLRVDLKAGKVTERLRETQDIERLLASRVYKVEKVAARLFLSIYWPLRTIWKRLRYFWLVKIILNVIVFWTKLRKSFWRHFNILVKKLQIRTALVGLKIIIGAGKTSQNGWIATDINTLNILEESNWALYFRKDSIQALLAEHVWEHLDYEEGLLAARNCFAYLKHSGYLRLAVPDAFNPDMGYIEYVKVGGHGEGSHDHKILYNYVTLSNLLRQAGFEVRLLEYFDEGGQFNAFDWDPIQGKIERSCKHDPRNQTDKLAYTSLIIDAVKK